MILVKCNGKEKELYLRICLKYGYEYTIKNNYGKLLQIRDNIIWHQKEKKQYCHIEDIDIDIVIDVTAIVAMSISYEDGL